MPKVRQAVILAGGRGTRLGALTDACPKPMLPVHGRPFIEYVVEMLRDAGIERIVFLLGYRADQIVDHFGEGQRFGVQIDYAISHVDDETGTRLRRARAVIDPLFLLAYCDNYWPIPLADLEDAFARGGRPALLSIYTNRDGYTRNNVRIESGRVAVYDKSRTQPDLAGVDIGYGIFSRDVLDLVPADGNPSFEATVYPQLVASGALGAFATAHRYYSIGSIERLPLTHEFLRRDKTVLVDRDGTLNVGMPRAQYVTHPNQWRWLPGALGALADLTRTGHRIIVITNQPGVARGALTQAELDAVHARMCNEAAAAGARIDSVLVCSHGWDDGCDCRKPKAGLLYEAQRRFSLDLSRTPFVGDHERDADAARAAGAPFERVDATRSFAAVVADLLKGESSFANAS